MDELLEALRTQGDLESTGHFTLDLRRALEKLEQYQFPEKHLYVLSLVASAVAGGATFLELEGRPAGLVLSYDGRPLELDDLRDLYGSIFAQENTERVHLRELAIGLHAAGRLHPERRLVSWDPVRQRGVQLWAQGNHLEINPLREPPFSSQIVNRVALPTRGLTLNHPELACVAHHARHSGILLRVNQQEVAERHPSALTLALEPEQWGPGLGQPAGATVVHRHAGNFHAVLELPLEPEIDTVHWVVNGLSFAGPLALSGFVSGFGHLRVYAPGLRKDLSLTRLVESGEARELASRVQGQLWHGLAELALRRDGFEEAWRARVSGWLLDLLARRVPRPLGRGDSPPREQEWLPLWRADWLDCAYGGKTSLERLLAQMQRPHAPPHLPLAESRFPYPEPPCEVLLETPEMRAPLRKLFRKVVYEW